MIHANWKPFSVSMALLTDNLSHEYLLKNLHWQKAYKLVLQAKPRN